MKFLKRSLLFLIFLVIPLTSHAQSVTVTGHLKSGNTNPVTAKAFLRFRLRNFSGNTPRVLGTGDIVQSQFDASPDGTGLVTTTIYANDFISPVNTFWTVETWYNGQFQFSYNYGICAVTVLSYCTAASGTFNLDSATPLSFPTPPSPFLPLPGPPGPTGPIGPTGPQGPAGSAGNPASPGFSLQYANAGVSAFLGAGGLTTPDGNALTIKGPDPHVDVTAFGARSFGSGGNAPSGIWASCTGTTTVSLTTANGGFTFVNGDGIEVDFCGPSPTMTTPSAPTVTPATAAGPTGTGVYAPIPGSQVGASTYNYVVVARDQFGGVTAASANTQITTGQATLGLRTDTISTITRSNDTLTVVTTGNNLVQIGVGANSPTMVHIVAGTTQNQMTGWYAVCSRTNDTTFTLCSTSIDTRVQGWSSADTFQQTTGTVSYYVSNHVRVTPVTGSWEYFVCAKRPGDSNYHLIGSTKPQGVSNGYQDIDFDDYGATFMNGQTYPRYMLTSGDTADANNGVCIGGAARAQMYSGIVTAGGGTTTLTVTPATSQTNAGPLFTSVDAEPGFLAAMKFSTIANNPSNVFGPTLIPGTSLGPNNGNAFKMIYPLIVPANTNVQEAGFVYTNESIHFQGNTTWSGFLASECSSPQFGWVSSACVYGQSAEPVFYVSGQANLLDHLGILSNITNGGVSVLTDNATGFGANYVSFGTNANPTDVLSMCLILRDTTQTISFANLYQTVCNVGPDQVLDKSWTPGIWLPPGQNGSGTIGLENILLKSDRLSMSRRGIAWTNAQASNGPFFPDFNFIYRQGGIGPLFTFQNIPTNAKVFIHNTNQDTEGNPLIACINPTGTCGSLDLSMNGLTSNNNYLSGVRPSSVRFFADSTSDGFGLPNRNGCSQGSMNSLFAPFDTNGSYIPLAQDLFTCFEPMHIPGGQSFYFDISQVTSVVATASGGGSVPAGTWYYCVSPIGLDDGEGICSLPSNSVVTAGGGNQTVGLTWTNPVGSKLSNIYRCSAGATCLNDGVTHPSGSWVRVGLRQTGASYSDTAASGTSNAGPTGVTGTGVSSANKNFFESLYFVCPETTAPSGVAGFDISYCDSTSHQWKDINNNGTAQSRAGFTITPTNLDCVNWSGTGGLLGDPGGKCARYTITPTNGDCVTWSGTSGLLGDAGAACGAGAGGMNTNMNNMANPTLMSQTLTPAVVNTIAVGTAALEFTNVFIGTVANQSGSFDTTALTANRVMKFPDASSTAVQNCPSASHQFLTQILQSTGACSQAQPTLADIAAGVSPSGLFDFTAATMELPEGAGFVATVDSTIGLDTTANTVHTWINSADAILAGFASAPAGSKCAQTSGTKGLLSEAAAACGTWTDSSTQTGTNKSINAEGTGNNLSEPVRLLFPAGGCINSTASNGWDIGVANGPTPQCAGTTVRKGVLQFARSNVAYLNLHLPKDWNSSASMDMEICFTTTDTTNGHVTSFNIQTGFNKQDGTVTDDPALNALQALSVTTGAAQVSGGELCGSLTSMTTTGAVADYNMEVAITRNNSGTDTNTDTAVAVKNAQLIFGVTKNAANR